MLAYAATVPWRDRAALPNTLRIQGQAILPLLAIVIYWLIQTTAAHPGLAAGVAPAGLLSAEETAVFNRFTVLKRCQDWLLGRWTMKLLLQEIIRQDSGQTIAQDSISILAGKDGAPRASFAATYGDLDLPFSVSISHSHDTSLCAAVAQPDWPLGVDIEFIEPRSANFAADFFTEEEIEQVRDVAPDSRETLLTAVWSGKEAALKAVHEGLRSDTRSVSCRFEGVEGTGPFRDRRGDLVGNCEEAGRDAGALKWQSFGIRWERDADLKKYPLLNGWWMVSGEFVLTMAAKDDQTTKDFGLASPQA